MLDEDEVLDLVLDKRKAREGDLGANLWRWLGELEA